MITGLVRQYYLNDTIHGSIVTAYKHLIYEHLQTLSADMGIDLNQTQLHADIEAVYLFEQKIAKISVSGLSVESLFIAGNKISFDKLTKQLNFVSKDLG